MYLFCFVVSFLSSIRSNGICLSGIILFLKQKNEHDIFIVQNCLLESILLRHLSTITITIVPLYGSIYNCDISIILVKEILYIPHYFNIQNSTFTSIKTSKHGGSMDTVFIETFF